jgi:tetratricopeptide (TPR) repeat protein
MKRFSKFLLVPALMALAASPSRATSPAWETSLSGNYLASRTASVTRDDEAASVYLKAALQQDVANPVLSERLFQTDLSLGRIAEAEDLATKVIAFNSQHRMAQVVLGLKSYRAGKYEEARGHFGEAAYTPIGELTATLLSAWSYAGEGNVNAALKELDKLDKNEGFANFKSFHTALIVDFLKNQVRAEAAYKKAYADVGTSLRVTQAYGAYLSRNGKFAEAEKVYQAFVSAGDNNPLVLAALKRAQAKTVEPPFIADASAGAAEVLFSLAAALNDDQNKDVGQIYAQLALSFNADKPVVLTLIGDILASSNRYTDAIAAYESIPADSVLRTNADTEIAINLQRQDKTAEAVARMAALTAKDPGNMDAWLTLGNIQRSAEHFAEAADAYGKALALVKPGTTEPWSVYYYRGICFEQLKQWDKAEPDFRKALALSPDEPAVLNYLGYSLIDGNRKLDEAIAMVKKAVELKPNDGYIVDSLGWAYFQMRDFEQAVATLERAVDLKAGDPIISEHLGDAYWRVGRRLEARFQWQHAKDNKPEPDDLKRVDDKLLNGLPDLPPDVKPADNGKAQPSNG